MSSQNKIVLVVEDDDLLRKIIVDQLSLKYSVISSQDGEDALKQAQSQKPDVIVLDLLLPKLDGFGFLEKLRNSTDKNLAKTAVLVVSNLSDTKSIEHVKRYGVLEYYIKSDIQMGILLNRISRFFSTNS